jgi:hypothetical protein
MNASSGALLLNETENLPVRPNRPSKGQLRPNHLLTKRFLGAKINETNYSIKYRYISASVLCTVDGLFNLSCNNYILS